MSCRPAGRFTISTPTRRNPVKIGSNEGAKLDDSIEELRRSIKDLQQRMQRMQRSHPKDANADDAADSPVSLLRQQYVPVRNFGDLSRKFFADAGRVRVEEVVNKEADLLTVLYIFDYMFSSMNLRVDDLRRRLENNLPQSNLALVNNSALKNSVSTAATSTASAPILPHFILRQTS